MKIRVFHKPVKVYLMITCQWWANPNPDLTNFSNPDGFGFVLKMFKSVDLDLSFFENGGFGFEL